ncbi:PH domain-containing protein [Erythrobacter sp.]|uniref:PH domain-containing protein n=1 Tax=Erythrobacter sp. TaxID=1042 RepID=UPI001425C5E3|nr:PH domain-containing protein [Erythrobacter sp.]QIQ87638.1 MAG: PH domain-containing protein [Erythrobacter sp.]
MTADSPAFPAQPAGGGVEDAARSGEPKRTAPLSVIVGSLSSAQGAIIPAIFAAFSTGAAGLLIGLGVGLAITLIGSAFAYARWRRLTYTVGEQDIRVESGLLSRAARSVPYERIQDVSLEQPLLARLFDLVAVKFETGAGGADDLALAFLSSAEGERLRQLVRERRDEAQEEGPARPTDGEARAAAAEEEGEVLFAMDTGRIFTFGLFEFSLAVFAVLGGLFQYANSFFDFDDIDPDVVEQVVERQGGWLFELGAYGQAITALIGLVAVLFIGSATGIARTFAREWGFVLERTARGFRRRRGLFTRTDVVMPVHRVQGLQLATGWLRYRFGWQSLSFVSLAQDAGQSSHVVAPFAQIEEIEPIASAAGFRLPGADEDWHRASVKYRTDAMIWDSLWFFLAAIIAGVSTAIFAPEWTWLAAGGPFLLGLVNMGLQALAWRFKRHALDDAQIMAVSGILSPKTQVATRLKLHSVEIAQGPIARWRGYATVHLGLAGGEFAIPGVPLERAREVRAKVLETIAATDFSRLDGAGR